MMMRTMTDDSGRVTNATVLLHGKVVGRTTIVLLIRPTTTMMMLSYLLSVIASLFTWRETGLSFVLPPTKK